MKIIALDDIDVGDGDDGDCTMHIHDPYVHLTIMEFMTQMILMTVLIMFMRTLEGTPL